MTVLKAPEVLSAPVSTPLPRKNAKAADGPLPPPLLVPQTFPPAFTAPPPPLPALVKFCVEEQGVPPHPARASAAKLMMMRNRILVFDVIRYSER